MASEQYSCGSTLDQKIKEWLKWDKNEKTKNEIINLIEKEDWDMLRQRLDNRLEFGTAGLRGCMRAGFDSMNDLVIVQTAQGFCAYVCEQFPDKNDQKERGIVIGYDGRYNSKRFAELTACVFVQHGIKVWLYGKMVATPFVPFGITVKNCLAGVMVTASHNPKEDNGYKVYWSNGAQIIPPHDKGIQKSILQHLTPEENSWDTQILKENSLLLNPYDDVFESYYKKLKAYLPEKILLENAESKVRFVYTAMHGVGFPFIEEAFATANLRAVIPVDEQKNPDPDFPTVKFPNPEEGKSALDLSLKQAKESGLTIILANDPDADRLACAELNEKTGDWKVFNGNELGALIGWWALQNYKELHPNVDLLNCYMLASTVSSKILGSMAKVEGYNFEETLTGFKWMGNRATELMAQGKHVIFAFEEAIGFMFSTNVLDKDGISAACQLATMASHLKTKQSLTLTEMLNKIYTKYGYHCNKSSYFFCRKTEIITSIFKRLRHYDNGKANTYPKSILNGKYNIKSVRDLTTGVDTSQKDGKAILPVSSSTQMITFTFEDGLIITIRTSGTEPKIKYYAEMCAKPEQKDWEKVRDQFKTMVDACVDEFYQPQLYKEDLIPKID